MYKFWGVWNFLYVVFVDCDSSRVTETMGSNGWDCCYTEKEKMSDLGLESQLKSTLINVKYDFTWEYTEMVYVKHSG